MAINTSKPCVLKLNNGFGRKSGISEIQYIEPAAQAGQKEKFAVYGTASAGIEQ